MSDRRRITNLRRTMEAHTAAVGALMRRRYRAPLTPEESNHRLLQDLQQGWTAGRDALAATIQQQDRVSLPIARLLAWFLADQTTRWQASVSQDGGVTLRAELAAIPSFAAEAAAIVAWCQTTQPGHHRRRTASAGRHEVGTDGAP